MIDRLHSALQANLSYRFSDEDFQTVGSLLLELPPNDPLGRLFGSHRHIWLRASANDNDRVEAANRAYLGELGLLGAEELDLDW